MSHNIKRVIAVRKVIQVSYCLVQPGQGLNKLNPSKEYDVRTSQDLKKNPPKNPT